MKRWISLLLLFCILVTLSGCGLTRRTESLDEYLKPQVPMSHTEFLLFPVRAALKDCTVNRYRSVSVSTLMFDDNYLLLSCTYTQQQYEEELSRLENIGAEYREDLFRSPAYVTVFYTHNYEYALLDGENLTITYIAAHTVDFENDVNEDQLKDFPPQFAPIKFDGVDICIYTYEEERPIKLRNGEVYEYFKHEHGTNVTLGGVSAENASRAQITAQLEPCEPPMADYGEIRSAEIAAYYGATALDGHIKNWTMVNMVGVVHNPRANLWIVHGMFKDRNTPGEAWSVVLEAETGKVLGFTSLLPSEE